MDDGSGGHGSSSGACDSGAARGRIADRTGVPQEKMMERGLIVGILLLGLSACGGGDKPTVVADVGGDLVVGDVVPDAPPPEDTPGTDALEDAPPDAPPETVYQLPEGCCDTEADCDDGQVCMITDAPEPGVCLDIPDAGTFNCWDDGDCPSGECRDAAICPCGADCLQDIGWCLLAGCCAGDGDCAGGERCVATNGAVGVCKPDLVAEYACWDDGDCDFGLCNGAQICPCGADCDMEDKAGTCATPPSGCCTQDADCENLWECVFSAGFPGVCKEPPAEGLCWSGTDCAFGDCTGPAVCPCDADCDGVDMPGWCTTEFPGCCFEDHHCPGGQYCADQLGAMGVCKDLPGPGECWEDADCPAGFCAGADICPCGMDCAVADQVGLCSDLLPGCCLSGADCGDGQVCAVPAWEANLGVCKDPAPGGCWSDADCGGGACADVILCPCGAMCPIGDAAGVCTEP
jgi:hypothetical protein